MKIGINARCIQTENSGLANYTINLLINLLAVSPTEEYYLFSPRQEKHLLLNDFLSNDLIGDRCHEVLSWPITLRSGSLVSQLLKVFWEKLYLTHELNQHQVDLLHDPSFSLPFNYHKPKILTIHDLSFLRFPAAFTARTYLYHKFFLGKVVNMADSIIAVSESVKRDILEFYKKQENKIKVIYEGVNELYLKPDDCGIFQEKVNKLVNSKPYILSVSAMNPRKNIPNIIRAFSALSSKHKDLQLVLVGRKAWGCGEIDKTVNELSLGDRIIFTGYIDDNMLKCLYKSALVFLYPSLYEGFGLPLLEAMACGAPVITSNISSMPEIVGQAGIFVDPHSYDQIADAIDSVAVNGAMRKELILLGKERVKCFSWRKAAEQTLAAYRTLK